MAARKKRRGTAMHGRTVDTDDIIREIGGVSEAISTLQRDRGELREDVRGLAVNISDLVSGLGNLKQTMESAVARLMALNAEKCGERLDRLEELFQPVPLRIDALEKRILNCEIVVKDLAAGVADWRATKAKIIRYIVIGATVSLLTGGLGAAFGPTVKTAIASALISSAGH